MKETVIYLRCSQQLKDRVIALRDAQEADKPDPSYWGRRKPTPIAEFARDLLIGALNSQEELLRVHTNVRRAIAAKGKHRPVVRGPQKKLPLAKKRGAK